MKDIFEFSAEILGEHQPEHPMKTLFKWLAVMLALYVIGWIGMTLYTVTLMK